MRWKGRRQSSNIEDRRGGGGGFGGFGGGGFGRGGFGGPRIRIPSGRGGRGLGLGGILVVLALFAGMSFLGIDPSVLLGGGGGQGVSTQSARAPRNDEARQFVATVLAENEDVWRDVFKASGQSYPEPVLVLFERQVSSGCGVASSATGPFYCPQDRKIYIDLSFYRTLEKGLGAGGDFAQAYVLAHEVGHHVQNVTGVLPRYHEARRSMSEAEANRMSVRVELQADCYAGVWAHHTREKGLLEVGDIEEALNAARQIGDDTLQRRSQGYVEPESFNHGTSQQRASWFKRGLDGGNPSACNTFEGDI